MAEILRRLGNLFYDLNGGLENVNNRSALDRLATLCWSKSYGLVEANNGRF